MQDLMLAAINASKKQTNARLNINHDKVSGG